MRSHPQRAPRCPACCAALAIGLLTGCAPAAPPEDAIAPEPAPAVTGAKGGELSRVVDRMLATPEIETEEGFSARVLVPPGELYDPLFFRTHPSGEVWFNDDGGKEGEKGSRILSVGPNGEISTIVGLGRLMPNTGFDIAPASFGAFEGYAYGVAQPAVGSEGTRPNHLIQRVDPAGADVSELVCTLPENEQGASGGGVEARFGPDGSPFEGRFFAVTLSNGTIHQVTPDGNCSTFITFDLDMWGAPFGIAFESDHQHMLAATGTGERGIVVRVRPDGTVAGVLAQSDDLVRPSGLAIAPDDFGPYAGQIFLGDMRGGPDQVVSGPTYAAPATGRIFRITSDGEIHLVAQGLHNPLGLHFHEGRLLVGDISGDFAGGQDLPEGFIVEITVS